MTPATATLLKMFAPQPLKSDLAPACSTIFIKQSYAPLYFIVCPEVIIMLLLTVFKWYDVVEAPVVITLPSKKDAKKDLFREPTKSTGFNESYKPKYNPLYTVIPISDGINPLYNPLMPSVANVFRYTSILPLNWRKCPWPFEVIPKLFALASAANLFLV